jgi:hypothetical protein
MRVAACDLRPKCYGCRIRNGERTASGERPCANTHRSRPRALPNRSETIKRCPAVSQLTTRWWPTAAKPMEAIHPHRSQSGSPPNWHRVTRVLRSAEKVVVVRAKMRSFGGGHGVTKSRKISSGTWSADALNECKWTTSPHADMRKTLPCERRRTGTNPIPPWAYFRVDDGEISGL